MKNYRAGMEAVRNYVDGRKDTPISLKEAKWK
jgi:hypothetical protein